MKKDYKLGKLIRHIAEYEWGKDWKKHFKPKTLKLFKIIDSLPIYCNRKEDK